jgi:hypothetical protein
MQTPVSRTRQTGITQSRTLENIVIRNSASKSEKQRQAKLTAADVETRLERQELLHSAAGHDDKCNAQLVMFVSMQIWHTLLGI